MLQLLLTALGPSYRLAYQGEEYGFPPVPGFIGTTALCVQFRNYATILKRTDVELPLTNLQSGQYDNKLVVQTALGPFSLPRAWVAVDATFDGKAFRLIEYPFRSLTPPLRRLQGAELRAGPANTSLPVIIAMDANAQAAPTPQDPTYIDFINAGYTDAWLTPNGFTCCQAELVNNSSSAAFAADRFNPDARQRPGT